MPELTPTGAVDVVVRQVRRVRRRKNSYELQRAVYMTIVAAALAATLLLPLALFAPARLFATAAWGGVAVLVGLALVFAGGARRRWLPRAAAVRWIEERGALAGRLRTLLEIGDRRSTRFFLPLLAAEVGRNLDGWAPRRLVPRRIPRAAGASAVLALAVLAFALRFAASSVPALPQVIFGNAPRGADAARTPAEAGLPGQVVIAPAESGGGDDDPSETSTAQREPSTLASLPSALQENVRRHVWGEAWERVRDTLARAGEEGGGGTPALPGNDAEYAEPGSAEPEDWEIARAPSGALTRRRRPGVGRQTPARGDGGATADGEAAPSADHTESDADGDGGGEGGAGAGSGTGPTLFGAPSADDGGAATSFELSLAARMRAFRNTDRPAGGQAPAADPDARPELAADQRRESAAHRMAVPAAYEPVVREVFAHRRSAPDQP